MTFLASGPILTSCQVKGKATKGAIVIDPELQFEISPYFYVQFMEPLGSTDGSVDAALDYDLDDWLEDVIDAVKDLAPDTIHTILLVFDRIHRIQERCFNGLITDSSQGDPQGQDPC